MGNAGAHSCFEQPSEFANKQLRDAGTSIPIVYRIRCLLFPEPRSRLKLYIAPCALPGGPAGPCPSPGSPQALPGGGCRSGTVPPGERCRSHGLSPAEELSRKGQQWDLLGSFRLGFVSVGCYYFFVCLFPLLLLSFLSSLPSFPALPEPWG